MICLKGRGFLFSPMPGLGEFGKAFFSIGSLAVTFWSLSYLACFVFGATDFQ